MTSHNIMRVIISELVLITSLNDFGNFDTMQVIDYNRRRSKT